MELKNRAPTPGPKVPKRIEYFWFLHSGGHLPCSGWNEFENTPLKVINTLVEITKYRTKKGFLNNMEVAAFKASVRLKAKDNPF